MTSNLRSWLHPSKIGWKNFLMSFKISERKSGVGGVDQRNHMQGWRLEIFKMTSNPMWNKRSHCWILSSKNIQSMKFHNPCRWTTLDTSSIFFVITLDKSIIHKKSRSREKLDSWSKSRTNKASIDLSTKTTWPKNMFDF